MRLPVAIVRQAATALFRQMTIPCACLIIVRAGQKHISFSDGRRLAASPGEAIALSAGEVVDVTNVCGLDEPYRADYIEFDDDMLRASKFRKIGTKDGKIDCHNGLATCVGSILQAIATDAPPVILTHRLQELLLWVEEAGIYLRPNEPTLPIMIRSIVEQAPARTWTTEAILEALAAKKQAMSEATLRRRLAEEGAHFTAIVTEVRMARALALIQTSTEPIGTIALECGYQSASRFALGFRKRFGIAPSALRGAERV